MDDAKPLPAFTSYEDMATFWDTHSLADYWDQTEPATFEVAPEVRRRYIVVTVHLLNHFENNVLWLQLWLKRPRFRVCLTVNH